jgi:N-acetylmuramic acid 6-phosphate etherase
MPSISDYAKKKADDFLRIAPQFRLGALPTESQHPATLELSSLANKNLSRAMDIFRHVDLAAMEKVLEKRAELVELAKEVQATFAKGKRVFLYGCGATGRLSISLEVIWRFVHQGSKDADKVISFMSGGDIALVRSIENFEDHPAMGARQVRELGFSEGDLMIATTEGGETPSVIGAVEEAARISKAPHYVLFCNPPELLGERLERCRRFLENPALKKIPILTGPMAISGSTRLQASTVLMLAVGMALFADPKDPTKILELDSFIEFYRQAPLPELEKYTSWEAAIYNGGGYSLYETDRYGITIFTDITERSPTFSLVPVENNLDDNPVPALAYLSFPVATDVMGAWRELLLREPLPLEWDELSAVSNWPRLKGYDFSRHAKAQRKARIGDKKLETLAITREGENMVWRSPAGETAFPVGGLHPEKIVFPMRIFATRFLMSSKP